MRKLRHNLIGMTELPRLRLKRGIWHASAEVEEGGSENAVGNTPNEAYRNLISQVIGNKERRQREKKERDAYYIQQGGRG